MKRILLTAAAVCLAAPAWSQSDNSVPLAPEPSAPVTMVITAANRPTTAQWSHKLGQELDRRIVYPQSSLPWQTAEGTVLVRFACGDDGKPASVALFRSSGNRLIDRAALNAVTRMATMHPMPARIAHDAGFQANIIFAVDQQSLDRQATALRRDEALRIARNPDRERAIVVLDTSRRTAR